jgi:hypothetical protein
LLKPIIIYYLGLGNCQLFPEGFSKWKGGEQNQGSFIKDQSGEWLLSNQLSIVLDYTQTVKERTSKPNKEIIETVLIHDCILPACEDVAFQKRFSIFLWPFFFFFFFFVVWVFKPGPQA